MCGIAGVVGTPSTDEATARVRAMLATIAHRGPDAEGLWSGDGAALGMRRLSIIDLPGGDQPMWSDGVGIVYNGEVYNYRALRDRLQAAGTTFRTQSDTEVVLEVYRAHGIEGLDLLEGMFAFCIYDGPGRQVHLVRDRLGKKPLYFRRDGARLEFASEIKALLAAGERPDLDRQAIHDYLTLRYVPAPATVWEGISKVEPGHRLRYDLDTGEVEHRPWWRLDFESEPEEPGRDYAAEFERLLLDSVEKRLVAADVPVGVLLSGGIDSSAVSAAAVELGHRDFHTFSIGFSEGGEWSELEYARQLSRHIGSRHHEVELDRDAFVDFLPELVYSTDEPLADLASVPLAFVSRLARQDVKVVLSGEGADEVLAGYDLEHTVARLDRRRRIASLAPGPVLRAAAAAVRGERGEQLRRIADGGPGRVPGAMRLHMTNVFGEPEKRELWRDGDGLRSTDDLIEGWYRECRSPDPLDQVLQVYCGSWLVEDLLMKADKMSMRNSLELRVPFLDHALVEWAARAPRSVKVGPSNGKVVSKRVLRDFARARLPAEIVDRPKRGFPVPAYGWLSGPLADWGRERLVGARSEALRGLFDADALAPVASAAAAGDPVAAHRAWSLIVLGEWLERWT